MSKIFSGTVNWLIKQVFTLLIILAVLLGLAWINDELKSAAILRIDRAGEVGKRDALSKKIEELRLSGAERFRNADATISSHKSILAGLRAEQKNLSDKHFLTSRIPLSRVWKEIKSLEIKIRAVEYAVSQAIRLKELTGKEVNTQIVQLEFDMDRINSRITGIDEALNKGFGPRLETVIHQELKVAVGILAGIIFLPIGIKVFFYFIVAPWAAGRPPIRLLPSATGSILSPSLEGTARNGRGRMSAVSQPIVLGENQELLIQPEYLQSTSLRARKETKWLLNASIPFTSLLSGMFMLTRVSPAESEPVVISATKDPLSEVGLIDLEDGAAFVCQPRSLAGVIQERRKPMRITRHWRLGSLQSWLTLQLRFLVFHGPGQLVMKGCRGIRIESAGTGRLINQAATLGFSANLDYSNTRCETFVSYWSGKEDLFNDLFAGESGVYVYEEMPDLKRTAGVGRHLDGFTDAILKVFGV